MHVSYQLQQIDFPLAQNRFVSTLVQVSASFISQIEIDRIAGQKPSHQVAEGIFARLNQQMKMVGHQRPTITLASRLLYPIAQASYKCFPIPIVTEYLTIYGGKQ